MKIKRNIILLTFIVGNLALGKEKYPGLELIKTETIGYTKILENHDKSRIYLKNGAIWVVKDEGRENKKLDLTLPDTMEIKNGKLNGGVSIGIESNYPYVITHYVIEIYRGNKKIDSLYGRFLNGNTTIDWANKKLKFKNKEVLGFKLKVYDKYGNCDVTQMAYMTLVKSNNDILLSKNTLNSGTLEISNILLNRDMVTIIGRNLKDVDTLYLRGESYSVDNTGNIEISQYFPLGISEIPVRIAYKNGESILKKLKIDLGNSYYVGGGIGDFYLGRNYISGNSEVLNVKNPYGPNSYTGNIYNEGRIAYFGKGRYGENLSYSGEIDTKSNSTNKLFKNILRGDQNDIFERTEDDTFRDYPTYGDNSIVRKDIDTKGKIYLDVNYKKSKVYWGNYKSAIKSGKFINYDRSLYGGLGEYKTMGVTKYGEDRVKVKGFISQMDTLYSHEKFLGTGGSLYFLKNGDILNSSCVVKIQVINSETGLVEKSQILERGKDYSLDTFRGRIILSKPLSPMGSSGEIIRNNLGGKYYNYLIVDYEYYPVGNLSLDNSLYGGDGKIWLNDYIGIGSTYINESKGMESYELKSGNITLRYSDKSYIKGEIDNSKGNTSKNTFMSTDGGINFTSLGSGIPNKSGNAYSFQGVLNLYDINKNRFDPNGNYIKTWYDKKDKNYSFDVNLGQEYLSSYGFKSRVEINDKVALLGGYSNLLKKSYEGEKLSALESKEIGGEYLFTQRILGSLEVNRVNEFSSSSKGRATLLGSKLKYKFNDSDSAYIGVQGTLNRSKNYEVNNMITVGGNKEINENLSLRGDGGVGNRGEFLSLGGNYNLTEDYSIYGEYNILTNENSKKATLGQRFKYNDKISLYQENSILNENSQRGLSQTYGLDYDITDKYSLGFSLENGRVSLPDNGGKENIKGFGITSRLKDYHKELNNRFEFRKSSGKNDISQYLTTNSYNYIINNEYTTAGKFNYSHTEGKKKIEFLQSTIGLAYRPIYNDKLNYLTRYTYLVDKNPLKNTHMSAHIIEGETIYDLSKTLDLGVKGALRREKHMDYKNEIYLIGLESNYKFYKTWEVYGQYHWLVDNYSKDLREGAIVGIYKNVNNNLKLGGGYNFSGFNDSLSVADYNSQGWFINLIGKI